MIDRMKKREKQLEKLAEEGKTAKEQMSIIRQEKDREIAKLKSELDQESKEKSNLINELDLDEYNLTSDDLRPPEDKRIKGNNMRGHPLVPWLNFGKIFDWREKQQ